jgi:hypothetical protein
MENYSLAPEVPCKEDELDIYNACSCMYSSLALPYKEIRGVAIAMHGAHMVVCLWKWFEADIWSCGMITLRWQNRYDFS